MLINSPEANFDVLYLLKLSKIKYNELHYTEINILAYLALLLSIYDGNKTNDWQYSFSYHSFGGPISSEIMTEVGKLLKQGIITSSNNNDYYSISNLSNTVAAHVI
jgi:hypothetical protein